MGIYRSYFKKNNGLIKDNLTNNSKNPVHELIYGTGDSLFSRFIFEIDVDSLKQKISGGDLNESLIDSHTLVLTNTVSNYTNLIGGYVHDGETKRSGTIELELYRIEEEWDEGNGYEFIYVDTPSPTITRQASNYQFKSEGVEWINEGSYDSGNTLTNITIDDGTQNIIIDMSDEINTLLNLTGSTYTYGIKLSDRYENMVNSDKFSLAFYSRLTNTFFEPHIETLFNDNVKDYRDNFVLNEENSLSLTLKNGEGVTVDSVEIIDYEGNEYLTLTGSSITKINNNLYSVKFTINSDIDQTLWTDKWNLTIGNRVKIVEKDFLVVSDDQYYLGIEEPLHFDNFNFSISGLKSEEKIKRGTKKKIKIRTTSLYSKNNNIPLDISYRVITEQTGKHLIDVINTTDVSVDDNGIYFFELDTSWMIPSDYYVEILLSESGFSETKKKVNFRIVD